METCIILQDIRHMAYFTTVDYCYRKEYCALITIDNTT